MREQEEMGGGEISTVMKHARLMMSDVGQLLLMMVVMSKRTDGDELKATKTDFR